MKEELIKLKKKQKDAQKKKIKLKENSEVKKVILNKLKANINILQRENVLFC